MKKCTFLMIFGLISVMIHSISASDEIKEIKYRKPATTFGLKKIRGSSTFQNKAVIYSRLNAKRFKREEEDATDAEEPVAPEVTEEPAESVLDAPVDPAEDATKTEAEESEAPEKAESVTGEPVESGIGSSVQAAVEEASNSMTTPALPQDGLSVGADGKPPLNIKEDIEDIVLSSIKLVVHIAQAAHNTTSQITSSITNKALEIKGNIDRTVQNGREKIFGTARNITEDFGKKLDLERLMSGILQMGKQ